MRVRIRTAILPTLLLLGGCFYVSNDKFDEAWDRDGDGYPLGDPSDPQVDCAPFDAAINPGSGDVRGDGCDSDCGWETDSDDDDHPDGADCDSSDPTIHPCAEDIVGDGIDSDCDGNDGPNPDAICPRPDPGDPSATAIDIENCPEELRTL